MIDDTGNDFTSVSDEDEKKAQRELDEAVANYMKTIKSPGVMTGYVLVAHHASYVDGNSISAFTTAYMNGDMPHHVILGLLEYGKHYVLDEFNSPIIEM